MIDLNKALFFDIETHRVNNWEELSEPMQSAFINHYYDPQSYDSPAEHYSEIAGLYAEFSHVICIVFGYYSEAKGKFITTEFHGTDEVEILNRTTQLVSAFDREGYYLAGHNIINCDIAYMAKRYIINSIKVPSMFNLYGTKPWDVEHLDTMDLWKSTGDFKRVSLEVICATLGIPCKTDELGGGNLYTYDIKDMPWDELVHYCTEDVVSNYEMTKHILTYYET